jgi:UDP-N-acetylmuramoyl-L-alanyl-D-glutamate--2,6-diaminopimelate ligase
MVGRYNILNALAAAATALASGLDMAVIQRGIGELENVPGRLQRVATGNLGFDVFVDYAHTDDALRNVLSALRPLTKGRLWCLFGCGGDRDRTKRPKMARAVAEGADSFIITSDNPRTEDPVSILADVERGLSADEVSRGVTILDRSRAIEQAILRLEPGDTLVIAGKGHENYQIIGTTKHHFDDVEVVAAAIETQARRLCHSEEASLPIHGREAR